MILVHSILTYYSPVWQSYLLSDINSLERIQYCTTKYILNDYTNDYKSRLINLNILRILLMHNVWNYWYTPILFLIKSIRNPTSSFNINNYITFSIDSLWFAKAHKFPMMQATSPDIHNNFNIIPPLWNVVLIINLMAHAVMQLRTFLFNHLFHYQPWSCQWFYFPFLVSMF